MQELLNTAYFFGTFNPVHTMHQAMVYAALALEPIEKVCVIPSAQPPNRLNDLALIDIRHRLAMCRLAFEGEADVEVLPIEHERYLKTAEPSYTLETLKQLCPQVFEEHEYSKIPLIIGADALNTLPSWKEVDTLIEHSCFLVAQRPNQAGLISGFWVEERYLALNTRPLLLADSPLSASEIRQQLSTADPLNPGLLDEGVLAYIQQHGLYK